MTFRDLDELRIALRRGLAAHGWTLTAEDDPALPDLLAQLRPLVRPAAAAPDAGLVRWRDVVVDRRGHRAWRGERELELTRTEFLLLDHFVEHADAVLARRDLLVAVWGYDFGGEDNVLGVYVGYLRRKLEAAGEPRVLHTVRGVGYVLRP